MSSIGINLVIKQSPRPLGVEGCALDCFKKKKKKKKDKMSHVIVGTSFPGMDR